MVYIILHRTLISLKPLRIRFDNVHGFVRVYDGTRYLVLFYLEDYPAIFNRTRYLVGVKFGITSVFPDNYARIKVDSYGWHFKMLKYTLSQFLIKIKITTTIIDS